MPPASASGVTIELQPAGITLKVESGASLQDVLFAHGVEFACGGRGRCKACRVRVVRGVLEPGPDDLRLLTPQQISEGWRLSCRARVAGDLVLELAQWESPILSDETALAFTPGDGLGVAVDLGTTTIVAQLLDLRTGNVLGVRTALNAQAKHGADIMSRIDFAARDDGAALCRIVREQIGGMIGELLLPMDGGAENAPPNQTEGIAGPIVTPVLRRIVIVGNTVMHHLFCGHSVDALSKHPFETTHGGLHSFAPKDLGWALASECRVDFLPCLGSFVGSDILAGVLATRLHESDRLSVLIDLGTNGEMVVGNRRRLLCASTAAGPAFEGARISMGMRAATGAISEVRIESGQMRCRVLGGGAARGLCGSGLVDAVAAGLETGALQGNGRLAGREPLKLADAVQLTQADVRELQLAKGAIAAGVRLLLQRWGATADEVERVYLAGAFGNYVSRASAWRIGLIDFDPERVEPSGNTALLGAKVALFSDDAEFADLRARMEHVPLADEPEFQEAFVEAMGFPRRVSYNSSSRSA